MIIKRLICSAIGLFLALPGLAQVYECDIHQELPQKITSARKKKDSEEYKAVYTSLYSQFEYAIKVICEFEKRCEFASPKDNDQQVRAEYAQTQTGKKILKQIEELRENFKFNAVDFYLFGGHELNKNSQIKITHTLKKGERTYYLDDVKVVAFLDHIFDQGVLTRLNSNCDPIEVVSFDNLANLENSIAMRVNKKYCLSQSQGKSSWIKGSDSESGPYFRSTDGVEEQMEAQELCNIWTPKPERMELVIDVNKPETPPKKTKGKKSTSKKSKRKHKAVSAE